MRLGKRAPRLDPRTLRLSRYVGALPPPPASCDWTAKMGPLGVMLNDSLGDCTCAAMGHMLQAWTGNASSPVILPDQDILLAYEAACGYDPANPATDQGGVELDVLAYWRNNGIGPAGHKIAAFAAINPKNQTEVMQAIALFGGIYVGVALPTSAQNQNTWDVTPATPGDAGSWGGHAIPILGYQSPSASTGNWFQHLFGLSPSEGSLTCVTWGATKRMTWPWFQSYCDEAYAVITNDWIAANGESPSGFDIAALQADLAALPA